MSRTNTVVMPPNQWIISWLGSLFPSCYFSSRLWPRLPLPTVGKTWLVLTQSFTRQGRPPVTELVCAPRRSEGNNYCRVQADRRGPSFTDMETIHTFFKIVLPKYLKSLPIPKTFGGIAALSGRSCKFMCDGYLAVNCLLFAFGSATSLQLSSC